MNRMFLIPLLALLLLPCIGHAETLDAVRVRMEKRLPAINAMKQRQEIGENNRGYLDVLKAGADADAVAAENADRKRVYEGIAETTGTSADVVGRQRARQIAERSAPGIMLQDQRGNWYEKK